MLRIGMVGAENFHALAFSKLANLPVCRGGCGLPARVTHIWGETPERTAFVAQQAEIPHIVAAPGALLGQVDAVMVVLRRGSAHLAAARPFLEAGMPTWVDKPLACELSEVEQLFRLADSHSALLDGGSACRYSKDLAQVRQAFCRMRADGSFLSAHFNFPGEINGPYDGLYFYGSHTAEILRTVFGPDVQSVRADVNHGNVIGLFRYPDFSVTVNFAEVARYDCILYGSQTAAVFPFGIDDIFRASFEAFVRRASGTLPPLPRREMMDSCVILDMLVRASRTGGPCTPAPAGVPE